MPRIEDWEITQPFGLLVKKLEQFKESGARNFPGINDALDDLKRSIRETYRRLEIAEQKWIVEQAKQRQAAAQRLLDEIFGEQT